MEGNMWTCRLLVVYGENEEELEHNRSDCCAWIIFECRTSNDHRAVVICSLTISMRPGNSTKCRRNGRVQFEAPQWKRWWSRRWSLISTTITTLRDVWLAQWLHDGAKFLFSPPFTARNIPVKGANVGSIKRNPAWGLSKLNMFRFIDGDYEKVYNHGTNFGRFFFPTVNSATLWFHRGLI